MAKRVFVNPHVSSQIKTFQEEENFAYGLVLGHFNGRDLMVIHLARTPLEEDEPKEEEAGLKSFTEVDPDWLLEHVKQVRAMLPGGMDVQGLFVSGSRVCCF